jgi:hypothetical protein
MSIALGSMVEFELGSSIPHHISKPTNQPSAMLIAQYSILSSQPWEFPYLSFFASHTKTGPNRRLRPARPTARLAAWD